MGFLIHKNFHLYFWFLRFCKQIDRPVSEQLPPSLSIPTRLKVWSNLKHCSRFCWILIVRFCWLPTELKSQLCWKQWKPQTKAHLVSGMCWREIFFYIRKMLVWLNLEITIAKKDIYWEVKTERKDDVSLAGSFQRVTCQEFERKDIKWFDISPKYQKIFIWQYMYKTAD